MLFNSFQFLVFFPVVTLIYFLLPHRFRWVHLLIASCVFYAAFIPVYILILLFTVLIDYYAGLMIAGSTGVRRKRFLMLSIAANVLVLAVFKYCNFFIDNVNEVIQAMHLTVHPLKYLNIILPIGLSFHTFQAMSYTIEVYRGTFPPERHIGYYALYVMFYPQLVAGPIERPQNVLPQLHQEHHYDHDRMVSGLRLMIWGLFKKVVVADRLGGMADEVYNHLGQYTGLAYIVATIFFGIQIYCDFSGYSDIAIGSARTMGIDLMVNFRRPYFSRSVAEFWRRWHISLSTWFRDYVFIPLGGSRTTPAKRYRNLMIVFLVSGFWHGASWTYVVWGALHGIYLIGESLIAGQSSAKEGKGIIGMVVTFALVQFAWIFFRAHSFGDAWQVITHLFSSPDGSGYLTLVNDDHRGNALYFGLPKWKFLLSCMLIPLLFMLDTLIERGYFSGVDAWPRPYRWALYIVAVMGILMVGVFDTNQFIYFQF